jgi:hypothetical protein
MDLPILLSTTLMARLLIMEIAPIQILTRTTLLPIGKILKELELVMNI